MHLVYSISAYELVYIQSWLDNNDTCNCYVMRVCTMYGVFTNVWESRSVSVIKGLCMPS